MILLAFKFTKTFQKIMGSQVGIFDKVRIGFRTSQKQKLYETFFLPKTENLKFKKICSSYKKI